MKSISFDIMNLSILAVRFVKSSYVLQRIGIPINMYFQVGLISTDYIKSHSNK